MELLGKHRSRLEDNINTDLKARWYDVEWVHLVQDREQWRVLMWTVTNLRVSLKTVHFIDLYPLKHKSAP
jgi:hypothetical protein